MFVPASAALVYEKQDQCEHWSPSNWDKRLPSLCFGSPWLELCHCVVEGWLQSASGHRRPLRVCCEAEGGLGALAGHAVFPGRLRGLRQSRAREEPCAAPGTEALAWLMGARAGCWLCPLGSECSRGERGVHQASGHAFAGIREQRRASLLSLAVKTDTVTNLLFRVRLCPAHRGVVTGQTGLARAELGLKGHRFLLGGEGRSAQHCKETSGCL